MRLMMTIDLKIEYPTCFLCKLKKNSVQIVQDSSIDILTGSYDPL